MATPKVYLCTACTAHATLYCECTQPSTTLCEMHVKIHCKEEGHHQPIRIYSQCTEDEQEAASNCIGLISYTIEQVVKRIEEEKNVKIQKLSNEMKQLECDYGKKIKETIRKLNGIQEELYRIKIGLGIDLCRPSEFECHWIEAKKRNGKMNSH